MASLRERRVKFTALMLKQLAWMNEQPGWEVAFDEGRVIPIRTVLIDGKKVKAQDNLHVLGSYHYDGLALDVALYVNGLYVSDGGRPEWLAAGAHWELLDPECSWGGHWHDANHLSLGEGK